MKPSDFVAAGFPYCSIFRECWHEATAVVCLEAMVKLGDEWKELTPDQVREAMRGEKSKEAGMLGSVLFDGERLRRVAQVLTSAEDALEFSPVWRRMMANSQGDRRSAITEGNRSDDA